MSVLRPRLLAIPALLVGATTLLGACASSGTSDAVMTKEQQQALTPQEALRSLKDGNERFVRGEFTKYDLNAQARKTANGQYPKAIILGCLDSRVPPEMVFDTGIGDLFVGRVAGNFENADMLGSMEFGTKLAGSKLIVVLGHTACGAVKGAIDRVEMGNLTATLANIEPAIASVAHTPSERTSSNTEFVNKVVEANVRITVDDIQKHSPVIRDLVRSGDLMIIGGVYDLATGRVNWLD